MRAIGFLKTALAHPQFEILEDRLVMSAQPVADFLLDYQVEQQVIQQIEPALESTHGTTGLDRARNDYGFDGLGQTVVVIDSGIAWDHVDLGGGFGAEYRVVGGWDFTENDANPYDDGPAGAHGTHVAGIIGSSHEVHSGVASGVDLVALRVFNDAGEGYFSWVEEALQWVHDHRGDFDNPITTVNLSIGATWNADTIPNWAILEEEFAQLEADGIFISVAAGNSFTSYNAAGVSYPAASQYVMPVASVDDSGQFSYFSQRNDRVIAAPGRNITSTVPDYVGNFNGKTDDYLSFSGTSMASPYVAGASVLIRQAFGFVGQKDVTQDDIYDVMRDTADIFHDPTTNASYHRLNLKAALDSIMPADDFGSTLATAHELGRLAADNPQALSGVFNTLDDADYLRFVADATGTVSVSMESLDNSSFSLELVGGTASDSELTFEVIAGETYNVRFNGGGALGHYQTSFELEAAEASIVPIELGELAWKNLSGDELDGTSWYRLTATRSGWLTAQLGSGNMQDEVAISFYDVDGILRDIDTTGQGSTRADILVAAGEEILVRVSAGSNASLLLANVVSIDGSAATVNGSAGDDQFSVQSGSTSRVTINGLEYQFTAQQFKSIHLAAGSGEDRVDLIGSGSHESVTLAPGTMQFVRGNVTITADNAERFIVSGKGGTNTALLRGSAGDDQFFSYAGQSWIEGDGYRNEVIGFQQVEVTSSDGSDRAYLYDSTGQDVFNGYSNRTLLERPDETIRTGSFDRVYAYSIHGGNDKAFLYDSPANDTYRSGPGYASFLGAGYQFDVVGYATTKAYSIHGGNDIAVFAGSAGDDYFAASATWAYMRIDGYYNAASGFTNITAFGNGGTDRADISGSFGDDLVTIQGTRVLLVASSHQVMMKDFEQIAIDGGFGGFDRAVFQDSSYDEIVYASPQSVSVRRGAMAVAVTGFDQFSGLPAATSEKTEMHQQALAAIVEESSLDADLPTSDQAIESQQPATADAYFQQPESVAADASVFAEWLAAEAFVSETSHEPGFGEIMRIETLFDQYAGENRTVDFE